MAESIRLRVACHACGHTIEGSARYGAGHYVPDGAPFDFVATGKTQQGKTRKVHGEVTCVCPQCTVKNKYKI